VTYPLLVDISNYQTDVTPDEIRCWAANGVQGAIVGCQRPAVARDLITRCREAGMPVVGVYAFLYWGTDTTGQTQAALDVAREFGIATVWLDCESSADELVGVTPPQRVAELSACVAMVTRAGLRAGIYTGAWWWRPMMANTDLFSDLPLWHAAYGSAGLPAAPAESVSYGGWSRPTIHQYTSGGLPGGACGRASLDVNYLMEEDPMTDSERRLLLLVATITFGPEDGSEFATVDAALAAAETLEANDMRLLTGIARTQAALGGHASPANHPGAGGVAPHTHTAEVTLS
jgi:GH25 family lysozyme M1 (1,4-beta-N-acetylmuramidase)